MPLFYGTGYSISENAFKGLGHLKKFSIPDHFFAAASLIRQFARHDKDCAGLSREKGNRNCTSVQEQFRPAGRRRISQWRDRAAGSCGTTGPHLSPKPAHFCPGSRSSPALGAWV